MALFFSARETFQAAGEFAAGRGEFLAKNYETALAHFEKVAKADPEYVFVSVSFSESVWTYLGRCQYRLGKLAEARQSFERALAINGDDYLARMFFGLALARQGDDANGSRELARGLQGLHEWIDDENDRGISEATWDPNQELRKQIAKALATLASQSGHKQKLIESSEWIGQKMEDEIDQVRREESRALE
ncbi:MAG: tetratricopeptide repeat protein [Deltaproteobacteria bacterium]|nr:tetratricopeptide repeat protein [Deltaproteobacteria bacterium]